MFDLHRRRLAWLRAAMSRPPALRRSPGRDDAPPAATAAYSPALRHGESGTADAFRARLAADAVERARIRLDPTHVPVELRGIMPLAEYWGICDDAIREGMQDAESQASKEAMADAVNPHNATITAWLDRRPVGGLMSDEAAAFMYLQLGLTELALFREE